MTNNQQKESTTSKRVENTLVTTEKEKKKQEVTPSVMEQPIPRSSHQRLLMHASNPVSVAMAAPSRDGQYYTKEQAVRILSAVPIKERMSGIDNWVKFGKIPCQKQHRYELLKKFSANPTYDLYKPWGDTGREPLLNTGRYS